MIQVVFRNLKKSELIEASVQKKIGSVLRRHSDLDPGDGRVIVSMENSPLQPGPDLFEVKIQFVKGPCKGLTVKKSAMNLYAALAALTDCVSARISQYKRKVRSKNRRNLRSNSA